MSRLCKTLALSTDGRVVRSLDQLCVLFERVGIALPCNVRSDEDILYRYLVPRAFYSAFVSGQRLPLRLHVTLRMVVQRQLCAPLDCGTLLQDLCHGGLLGE